MTAARGMPSDGDLTPVERSGVAAKTGVLTERRIGTTMDDLRQGADFFKQSKATQYLKPGGFSQAHADFDLTRAT